MAQTSEATREEQGLIRRYNILWNRMNAFTTAAPLRRKVETQNEMNAIEEALEDGGFLRGEGRDFYFTSLEE